MLLKAFACVLMAAATAAGCTAFVSRRRASHGLAGPVQLSEASRWVYRRVSDLSGRGAERHDPHMAARISHARQRARNQRARKERERERARKASMPRECYSLARRQCDDGEKVPDDDSCTHPAADHLAAKEAKEICGTRLPRRNPCWKELVVKKDQHGRVTSSFNTSCLPSFLLLGEMRSGTTSLYKLLGEQTASITLPTVKEPRYLTLPNYRHHTGGAYALNFAPVVNHPDKITFDASPTMFNAPLLAPSWLHKWLPDAKLVILLREPSQRTYSHWRTGLSWLRSSPCFRIEPPPENATASERASLAAAAMRIAKGRGGDKKGKNAIIADAFGSVTPGLPAPIPEIRMMREVFSFEAVARLGIMEVVLRECGAQSGWGKEGGVLTLTNRSKACILESHVGEAVAGLWHARQALARRRSEDESVAYAEGMRRVSVCSEFMLRSGAGVWRSSRYAANLQAWRKQFAMEQLKVIATEELERKPKETLDDVLSFLGLPKSKAAAPAAATKRYWCLNGRHGVMDEGLSRAWHAGRLDGASEGGAGGGIGECDDDDEAGKVRSKDGVRRYEMEPSTEKLLKQFFSPYNEKLFELLGRRLEW